MQFAWLRDLADPLLAAIVGGLVVHLASRRRDAENERRRQRVDYLIRAYRTLSHSAHRPLTGQTAENFEDALSDVILFGNGDQIRLARRVIVALAEGGEAPVDDLLVSFRRGLRHELDLASDNLTTVPLLRFTPEGQPAERGPLTVQDAWQASAAETRRAAATAAQFARSPDRDGQEATDTIDRVIPDPMITGARELAVRAPGAAVQGTYQQLSSELRTILDVKSDDDRQVSDLAREANERGLISSALRDTFNGLTILRNLSWAGGSGTGVSEQQANDYIDLAEAALYAFHAAT